MSGSACARSWEAEALQDGRLGGSDRASFERHAAGCATCRRDLAELAALREQLAFASHPPPTALEHQRARAKLIRSANELTAGRRARRLVPLAIGVAVSALVIGAGVAYDRRHPTERVPIVSADPVTAPMPPRFDAKSSSDAVWRPLTSGGATRVELSRGAVSFVVPHLEPSQGFVVVMPDGEIEVRGTAFTVVVDGARTMAVNVSDGTVALRIRGKDEVLLHAGELWPQAIALSEPSPAATAAQPAPRSSTEPAPHRSTPRRSGGAKPSPGSAFDEAFASFEQGDYALADAELARFAREYPTDPRVEDASYLRAIARARAGDREGARRLAKAYLEAFPAGLRHLEAKRLTELGGP